MAENKRRLGIQHHHSNAAKWSFFLVLCSAYNLLLILSFCLRPTIPLHQEWALL
ncbi:hypothetical protein V6N12_063071 [Hibiscus sabdariffa]|uniref:Uncharacterized protein n=1 Tax=Hibiscus sabdariffa TaxID=183260 RepID=A0ABR2FAQ5_9ROSI